MDYEFWPQILCVIHDQTMLVTYFTKVSIKILKLCFYHMFRRIYLNVISFKDYILIIFLMLSISLDFHLF